MDAQELLKTWPGIGKAGATTLLSLPAWRMSLDLDGREAELLRADAAASDEILLRLDFDGGELTLGIADSPLFPDLHLLWTKRAALPSAVVLALVEKECGDVFGAIETATGRLLSVSGFAEAATESRLPFLLKIGDKSVPLSLSRNRTVELTLGQLRNIDSGHASIREMTRDVLSEYAAYPSSAVAVSSLAAGDRLLLPEKDVPHWRLDESADDVLHLCGAEPTKISFAALADDSLPAVPEPQCLKLLCRGAVVATGDVVTCGDARAFCIREIP